MPCKDCTVVTSEARRERRAHGGQGLTVALEKRRQASMGFRIEKWRDNCRLPERLKDVRLMHTCKQVPQAKCQRTLGPQVWPRPFDRTVSSMRSF